MAAQIFETLHYEVKSHMYLSYLELPNYDLLIAVETLIAVYSSQGSAFCWTERSKGMTFYRGNWKQWSMLRHSRVSIKERRNDHLTNLTTYKCAAKAQHSRQWCFLCLWTVVQVISLIEEMKKQHLTGQPTSKSTCTNFSVKFRKTFNIICFLSREYFLNPWH